jgi:hypothetical protein
MAQPYDGEIAYADHLVGRFLDRLAAHQLLERALSSVAIVSVSAGNRKPACSRTQWWEGYRPDRMFACEGRVTTVEAWAAGETDATGGQPIQPRGRHLRVAVGAERIGAQRIDDDQEDVLRRVAMRRRA